MGKVFSITEGLENMGALRTGGQGSVYKARRMGPIISAVKLLPTPIHSESTDDKNYSNFLNEVEKLKKVNEIPNPNVVKILNSGITESGSFPFIEMEFIEGPDLEELLKPPHEALFSIKETIKVADQLANALSHCHKVGVKHGDIKSNNIKYNVHSGNYVLLDFGLSAMSDEQRRTSLRHAGAIEFMAPEQNEGRLLFQTDVYSLGVILFELLAGEVPFPLKDNGETSRNAVMIAHMESKLPDILELRRQHLPESWTVARKGREMQVPRWLLDIIERCLEKLPEKRYPNGIALHDAIFENSIAERRTEHVSGIDTAVSDKEINNLTSYSYPRLKHYDNRHGDTIRMPKPVFAGLIVLLLGFMVFTGYSLFSTRFYTPVKSFSNKVVDTTAGFDTGKIVALYEARRRREKKRRTDSIILKAINEEPNTQNQANPDSAIIDTTNKAPNNNN